MWSTAGWSSLWHFEKFNEHYVVFPPSCSVKMSIQKHQSCRCHISEFHPSVFYEGSCCTQGRGECWSPSQMSLSEDSRTSRQFIAGPDTKTNSQTSTHSHGQIRICVSGFWTVAGSRSTLREPTQAHGERANPTQNQEPSCCEATVGVFPWKKIAMKKWHFEKPLKYGEKI